MREPDRGKQGEQDDGDPPQAVSVSELCRYKVCTASERNSQDDAGKIPSLRRLVLDEATNLRIDVPAERLSTLHVFGHLLEQLE